MTIEEAKDYIREWCPYDRQEEIIKALEQEPCDDAISRQAVLAIAGDSCLDLDSYEDTKEFCDEIKELPSVTPQPKIGRWIKGDSYGDQYNYYQSYVCSCCKREYDVHNWKYCPNCGAKMQEVEE